MFENAWLIPSSLQHKLGSGMNIDTPLNTYSIGTMMLKGGQQNESEIKPFFAVENEYFPLSYPGLEFDKDIYIFPWEYILFAEKKGKAYYQERRGRGGRPGSRNG